MKGKLRMLSNWQLKSITTFLTMMQLRKMLLGLQTQSKMKLQLCFREGKMLKNSVRE
jgi:hypothetical protein